MALQVENRLLKQDIKKLKGEDTDADDVQAEGIANDHN